MNTYNQHLTIYHVCHMNTYNQHLTIYHVCHINTYNQHLTIYYGCRITAGDSLRRSYNGHITFRPVGR